MSKSARQRLYKSDDRGRIRWIDRSGDEEVWLDSEPKAGFWRRFSGGFMRILPIKSQL